MVTHSLISEEASTSVADRLSAMGYDGAHTIGTGAGGAVYKALQRSTGQTVAVKVLSSNDLEPEAHARRIERFRREIAFCSSLYHPDIVRLLDSGELEDGQRFAVFEYIPGRTLAELLRDEGMLSVARARRLLSQLLPPLAYAHAKGIAHRDLKPGNVMVTTDAGRDRIKVLDFGISIATTHPVGELRRLTQSHEWVGTPIYAAPEQLRGEPSGAKADLYAWGLMFVEALTGSTLVTGKSLAEIITQQFKPEPHELPPALAQHRLGALILRTIEKDPARRLGDPELVQSLLERISTEGLEDARGYLREANPVSAEFRSKQSAIDTVTDARVPEHTEHRRITALCCRVRLVGTGSLSHVDQLDALLDDSQGLISEILQQFGATPVSSTAGYSLWYLGLSHARDDDARLAVRGALEIVNRIKLLPGWFGDTGLALAVQIGVHNGPITVRVSEGRKLPLDGLTARAALDLAAMAGQGPADGAGSAVLVSEDFRELVARSADLEPYEGATEQLTHSLGGRRVFRLTGESRSTSLRPERSPFVGRSGELDALASIWRRTGSGEGATVLISGEPGIGKSRLAAELMLRLDQEGCRAFETRCLPEWQNASLRPVQGLMQRVLGLAGSAGDPSAHLEQRVRELGLHAASSVPLLCVWLSLPLPPGFVPLTWSPQKQRQLLHERIVEALVATMDRGNALLVEDIHWADPSTLELLDQLAGALKSRSALVVLTSRPDKAHTFTHPVEQIVLGGLDDVAVQALATALLPGTGESGVDLSPFVARCDGIPLYVEELALALRQRQRSPDPSSPFPAGTALEGIPASLHALLTSRLDEIGEGRRTAQFAAALGREFSLELLGSVEERDEFALASDLEELVAAHLLVKRLRLGSPVYMFRHALIRDAAYDTMEPQVRQRTHESIAFGLEGKRPSLRESEPDVLAHHFERAQQGAKAMHYWQLAAQKSSFASAHLEAITHIDRALELMRAAPPAPGNEAQEAQLLLTRGAVIVVKRGYTDLEAKACFDRIGSLVRAEGDTLALAFAARWGLWYFNNARANMQESCRLADELMELARNAGDPAMQLAAETAVCESRCCAGQLELAVAASRRCAEQYSFERDRMLALRYGDDPRLASGSFEAIAEIIRGNHVLALERVSEMLAFADRLESPALKAGMLGQAAWVHLTWGTSGANEPSLESARQHAAEAIRLSSEHGFPFWELYGGMNDAAIRIAGGDAAVAPQLRYLSDLWCSFGANLGRCWHLTYVGQGLQRSGSHAEALQCFDQALDHCTSSGSFFFEPEVRRQRACLLGDPNNPARDLERALQECERAEADAERLGARFWQLASAVSAIRLDSALRPSALRKLAAVLATFPSVPSSLDPPLLLEARRLVA